MYNLLMVTLDAVRPDHLGCYGYRGVETPNLDALALHGVLFEQAVTHAPNTWVAHATLFTGCLPPRHALRTATSRISSSILTLAEWLSNCGYATAAFPGTTLVGRPQGFQRGFDLFDEAWLHDGYRVKDILWRLNWADALGRAKKWIQETPEPFFLWLHYIDTHHLPEYDLPEYFRLDFSPRWQHYDGKISYADEACIGNILKFLEKSGLQDRTILIVLSDHGEELLDDDRAVHDGGLKDDVIRVPLIIGLPAPIQRSAIRVSDQFRLVDLYPTACDLLNISPPSGLQGQTFLNVLKGHGPRHDHASLAYLENWPKGYLGIRSSEWKLILRHSCPEDWGKDSPNVEGLYHLSTDPGEDRDLSEKHPSVLQHLKTSCLRWAKASNTAEDLTPEDRERIERVLRKLGYL
jgi:arylsulfatase A-like enzyme